MIRSYLFGVLCLFVCALIETAVLSNIFFLPAVPDFLLICSLYFSVSNGCLYGEVMGFTSGLFIDFLSGSPFGLNCLVRTITGYFSGFFKKTLNLHSVFVTFLLGFFGTLAKALLIYCASFLFPNMINTYNVFSPVFLFELAFNSILTPFVFKFFNCFSNFIVISKRV